MTHKHEREDPEGFQSLGKMPEVWDEGLGIAHSHAPPNKRVWEQQNSEALGLRLSSPSRVIPRWAWR